MSEEAQGLDFRGIYRVRAGQTATVIEWKDGRWRGHLASGVPESWNEVGDAGRSGPHPHDLMERMKNKSNT